VRLVAAALRLVEGLLWSKGLAATFLLSAVWTVAIYAAPLTLPPNALLLSPGGGANRLDNMASYGSLNPFAYLAYVLGDAECHQLPARSLFLQGNQMPVCVRCAALFTFANLGLLTAATIRPASTISRGLLNVIPRRGRDWLLGRPGPVIGASLVLLAAVSPAAVDGGTQAFGWRESTNTLRAATGALAGWGGGLLVGVMLTSSKGASPETRSEARRRA